MKTKEYKVERAPVGTRFTYGGHSTPLIVTDLKETSNTDKFVVCVSENGFINKIPYGTNVLAIEEQAVKLIINSIYGAMGKPIKCSGTSQLK